MPDQKMQEELQQLQLEEARAQAQGRKQTRADKENKARAIEMSLRRDRERQKYSQSVCAHRKGGKGKDGIYNGNDANYAIIIHTLSHGPTIVVCQRCGKVWEPPPKLTRKASPEMRAKYANDFNDYRRALALPTDNEASGTVLFEVIHEDEAA